jgi:hypothetical protein
VSSLNATCPDLATAIQPAHLWGMAGCAQLGPARTLGNRNPDRNGDECDVTPTLV